MAFISLTRLRIRSIRFLLPFFIHAQRSTKQLRRTPGFIAGELLVDRRFTFWTLTAWDNAESMRAYMTSGAHKAAMPKLMTWCDEAHVAHWAQAEAILPTWEDAHQQLRANGRASKVHHPSPRQADRSFDAPRPRSRSSLRPE